MPSLQRLHPDRATLTPGEAFAGLRLGERAPAERPYVVANMVATADGKAAIDGRSGPIGDEVDRDVFHRLRTQVDAVLVGSGTLRAERYGRLVRDPALRDARVREGLSADPLGAVLSRSLDLPLDAGFFADPASRTVAFTSAPAPARDWPAGLELVELDPGELTLTTALRRLRAQHGVRSVLCEGGPTVLGLLLAERMLDELFLTVAPKVAGGTDEPAIVTGVPMPAPVGLRLVWVLEAAGSLYLRYAVPPDPARAQPGA